MVHHNSVLSYHTLKFEGPQTEQIARLILHATNNGGDIVGSEIAEILRMQIGTVSARLNALKKQNAAGFPITLDFAEYRLHANGDRPSRAADARGAVGTAYKLLPFAPEIADNSNLQSGQQTALFN